MVDHPGCDICSNPQALIEVAPEFAGLCELRFICPACQKDLADLLFALEIKVQVIHRALRLRVVNEVVSRSRAHRSRRFLTATARRAVNAVRAVLRRKPG